MIINNNISLKDFDILALSHISINLNNLESIINLALTCKDYYKELEYLLLNSNATLIKSFNKYNKISFENTIKNSYYTYSNLKYYFNTHKIPLPLSSDDITYTNVKNTEIIYNHFFYEHNNKSDEILYKYYYELFKMKYGNKITSKIPNEKYNERYFELRKYIDVYFDYYKYILYNSKVTNYKEINTPLFNDDGKYSSNVISYRYNYIISHLELYSLNIFLNEKKYDCVIQILENLEFKYTSRIGINELLKKIKNTIDIECYFGTTIYTKLTMIYILVHYMNEIYKRLYSFCKPKKRHYYNCIIDIIELIKNYYYHNSIFKDGYNRCKPKYFFDYMKVEILDYCINLI